SFSSLSLHDALPICVVIGRALFADSNFDRLLQKLSFKYDGFGILTKLAVLPTTTKLALLLGIFFIGAEVVFQKCKHFNKRNYKRSEEHTSELQSRVE